ncbi:hypothetical protein E2562_016329 [Oryza meyeriana var. granulata]|uniref:Uncharacterized protein n=1 Tax=Oryza meyeriana var. granulata TaxID=110450 RepID=A0A6G1DX08_9ORYZ|nr:hypothetical protein E2562_016329 [Oryza meyeriana var. granulata]
MSHWSGPERQGQGDRAQLSVGLGVSRVGSWWTESGMAHLLAVPGPWTDCEHSEGVWGTVGARAHRAAWRLRVILHDGHAVSCHSAHRSEELVRVGQRCRGGKSPASNGGLQSRGFTGGGGRGDGHNHRFGSGRHRATAAADERQRVGRERRTAAFGALAAARED